MELPQGSIIASGPVIIEDGKVLLNREQKDHGVSDWFFPGGKVEDFDTTLKEACHREVKEEMGLEIEITKPLKTIMYQDERNNRICILVHWLADRVQGSEVEPAKFIADWAWHDINDLPDNCADNVVEIISEFNS
ncbi:MAG: NUDIX hydrolase [Candidatus Paceibacteria bacterium]